MTIEFTLPAELEAHDPPEARGTPRDRVRMLVTGPPDSSVTYAVTRRRWQGLLDAWREAGGAPGDLRIAVCQANATGLGEAFADELFRTGDPPDAIAAMSDELALGALRAAARAVSGLGGDARTGGRR